MNEIESLVEALRNSYSTPENSIVSHPGFEGFNFKGATPSTSTVEIPITESHVRMTDGTWMPKYDSFTPGVDNNEVRAQMQGTGEKWKNGLLKFGGKTFTAIVGGVTGTVKGMYDYIRTGSEQTLYDNDIYRTLEDMNTWMDYKLPNYYTQAEQDKSLVAQMGTANFWANDVLGGISFTAGAIGTELLLGKGLGLIGKAGRLPQIISNVNKGKNVAKLPVNKLYADGGVKLENLAIGLGKTQELAKTARFLYTSSGYEASVVTAQFRKEQEESFNDQFMQMYGRLPNMDEISEFNENLNKASNSLFGFNTILTGSSKMLQIGNLVGVKTPSLVSSKWVNSKLFGTGVDINKKALSPTKFQKIARRGYGLLRGPLVEGFEEGSQSVSSNTAENWLTATYSPKYIDNSIALFDAFADGLTETVTSKEGLKEILIGALVGGLTGGGVGLATRQTASSEFKKLDKEAQEYATYSEKQIGDLIAFTGRSQQAQEQLESAEEKGDFTAMEQARKAQMLAHISYTEGLGYGKEGREEAITSIQAIDAQALADTYDMTVEEAEAYKTDMINDFNKTFDSYKRHKDFAKYYIGDDIVEVDKVQDAVATVLTLGEGAYDFNQTILGVLKEEISNIALGEQVLDIVDSLQKATVETQREFSDVSKDLLQAQTKLKELESTQKDIIRKSTNPRLTQEQKQDFADQSNQLALDIVSLQEQKVEINNRLNVIYQAANLENPYSNKANRTVSEQELEQVDTVLQALSDLPSKVARTDVQKASAIENLINEYNRSNKMFKDYADLSRQLMDGRFDPSQLSAKAFKNKTQNELILEFLGTINTDTEDTTTPTSEMLKTVEVVKKEAQPFEGGAVGTIIQVNPYLQYKGAGTSSKPTSAEVEELKNLRDLEQTPIEREDGTLEIDFDPLTEEQQLRKEELEDKFAQWELYDSFAVEGVSLLDMVDIDEQLEATPEFVDNFTPTTIDELGSLTESSPGAVPGGGRYEEVTQTYDGVQIRTTKDGTFLHSTSLDNILMSLSDGVVEDRPDATVVEFPDGTTTAFEITSPGVVKVKGWENVENNTTMKRMQYTGSKNAYGFVFVDGTMMETDIDTSSYNNDAVYDASPGDSVRFRVDMSDPYNQALPESEYESNIKIHIVDKNGNVVGDLKSGTNIKGTSEGFKVLRLKAKEIAETGGGFIPLSATVRHVYLGTPVFTLDESGVPLEQDFDTRDVLDWGYYENGEFELVNDTSDIRTSFVQNFGRRIPVVVFRRGKTIVAFPVNLKTTSSPKGEVVIRTLEQGETIGKAVKEVNQMSLDNGFPATLFYRGVNDQNIFEVDGSYTQDVQTVVENLSKVLDVPNLLDTTIDNLKSSISSPINFSSRPITSPKLVLDLENLSPEAPVESRVESKKEAKVEAVETEVVAPIPTLPTSSAAEQIEVIPTQLSNVDIRTTDSADGNTYKDYTFKEGSSIEDFKNLATDGADVTSPIDFFVVVGNQLISKRDRSRSSFPTNPAGWSVSVKVEKLSDEDTSAQQNKKC